MAKEVNYCCQDKKFFSELCQDCVKAMTTFNPDNLNYPEYDDYSDQDWPGSITYNKCECGSDKTGGPGHSYWCPKHENKT